MDNDIAYDASLFFRMMLRHAIELEENDADGMEFLRLVREKLGACAHSQEKWRQELDLDKASNKQAKKLADRFEN